jgi:hypothetical protein
MFQDEARFGRINEPKRCWAGPGERPQVKAQLVREFTYAYSATCPKDGRSVSLILPEANTECMNLHLEEIGRSFPGEEIILVLDGAGWHKSKTMALPANLHLLPLPPYCPDLNPQENVWKVLRETWFDNLVFSSMDAVEDRLELALKHMGHHPEILRSVVAYPWLIDLL